MSHGCGMAGALIYEKLFSQMLLVFLANMFFCLAVWDREISGRSYPICFGKFSGCDGLYVLGGQSCFITGECKASSWRNGRNGDALRATLHIEHFDSIFAKI